MSLAPAPLGSVMPELVILPRAHDVGGFEVRRALPATERQMIGPFIFFDQIEHFPIGWNHPIGSNAR